MKKMLRVLLVFCCIVISTETQAEETTVNMNGTGIAWSNSWGPDFHETTVNDISISSTLTLQLNGLQVQWVLNVASNEIGYQDTFILDDINGNLNIDPTNLYASIRANSCWGFECPVDDARPDSVGHKNLIFYVNMTTLQGYFSIESHENSSEQNTGLHLNLMGNIDISL